MAQFQRAFFLLALALPPTVLAAGITGTPAGYTGATTYPPGATNPAATSKAATPAPPGAIPSIVVPTPDTIPPPTIPTPVTPSPSLGKYRKAQAGGAIVVNIEGMLHDRYKQSVVRVTAKDLAGNVLAKAMGVGIGRNSQFIATPLSLVLGSSQQWADKIEITHFAGNKYDAQIALIDEEKNLVLLAPEASPAPIVFTRDVNERPQIDVFTISFDATAPDGSFVSSIHRGRLAAANPDTGLMSVSPYSGQAIDDAQAGTGVLDSEGNLVGMLLPNGRGVLSSTLQKSLAKAQRATPLDPRMIGVILGRGVLVDSKGAEGAFKTIQEALDAIKKGSAPKMDTTRFTPARNRAVAPKETDKVVIKVMPGTYREKKPISLPSDTSLSGSGPAQTVIVAPDPNKPAILIQNAQNVMVAGFRITPAALQSLKAPTVIISKSSKVTLLGNTLEAKGGVSVWLHEAKDISLFGNTFARGTIRGLSCDKSDMKLETNAFVGEWPVAVAIDKDCRATAKRNLFFENKNSISIASTAGAVALQQNTFVRSPSAVKLNGDKSNFSLQDNIFFECTYGLLSVGEVNQQNLGRNAAWRSKLTARSKALTHLDVVKTEPIFEAPASYDFRVKPGKGIAGSSLLEPGGDIGAYQRTDFLGKYSGPLARSLGAVTGDDDLAGAWGLNE